MTDDELMANILDRIDPNFGKYIDCGEGWHPIICRIHAELLEIDPEYVIHQIKEKFGSLRYYFAPSNPTLSKSMHEIVERYSIIADSTCEVTGGPGVLMVSDLPFRRFRTLGQEFEGNGWTIVVRPEP